MPSKKKKYNSRFPPARIKKIMQTDEEIGKVAAAVPVLISKCLEMFLASLLTKAGEVTKSKRAKTMSRSHLKQCIMSETMFDFLKDHVANIPDVQNEDEASGSMSFPIEKEPAKKVVRKRSLSKVKKTPKKRQKRGHSNNNESEESTDSAEDASENGSGNEGSDAMLSSSFSSPGLISPTIHAKLEIQSTSLVHNQPDSGSSVVSEQKPSIHIPLDVLLSSDEVPATVNVNQAVKIEHSTDKIEETQNATKYTELKNNVSMEHESPSPKRQNNVPAMAQVPHHASPVRQGVIVANTVAYPQPTPSVSTTNAQNTPSMSRELLKTELVERINSKECQSEAIPNTSSTNREEPDRNNFTDSDNVLQDGMPPVNPRPGGMLSLLYSSTTMPLPSLPAPPTVRQVQSSPPQVKYAYSPLSQHRFSEPNTGYRQPLLYPGIRPSPNDAQRAPYPQPRTSHQNLPNAIPIATPYPYPYSPYDPSTTQRHYLGYPQAMLTPPSHHLAGINSHLEAHPSLHQAKPNSRAKSDDDDYDA